MENWSAQFRATRELLGSVFDSLEREKSEDEQKPETIFLAFYQIFLFQELDTCLRCQKGLGLGAGAGGERNQRKIEMCDKKDQLPKATQEREQVCETSQQHSDKKEREKEENHFDPREQLSVNKNLQLFAGQSRVCL